MNEQINKQLEELEAELSHLKQVTDYIDGTKDKADIIISKLGDIQENYASHLEKIVDVHKSKIDSLVHETEIQIKESVVDFETVSNNISKSNREQIVEVKRLVEESKKINEKLKDFLQIMNDTNFQERIKLIELQTKKNGEQNHFIKLAVLVAIGFAFVNVVVILVLGLF
jgi:uncharacterized NAD(P)/FAD-binding protein YdhS